MQILRVILENMQPIFLFGLDLILHFTTRSLVVVIKQAYVTVIQINDLILC
jgi:hypothetical protein